MFVKSEIELANIDYDGCTCPKPTPQIAVQKIRYVAPERPKIVKHNDNLVLPNAKFQNCTIYCESYQPQPYKFCRPKPYKEQDNLSLPKHDPFEKETINKLSYCGWTNIKRPTQFRMADNLRLGRGLFASHTTSSLSYQPMTCKRPDQVKHTDSLKLFSGEMSDKTVQRLSYIPVPLPDCSSNRCTKQKILKYCPPQMKLDDNTVYRMSYKTPGYYERYWTYEPINCQANCHC